MQMGKPDSGKIIICINVLWKEKEEEEEEGDREIWCGSDKKDWEGEEMGWDEHRYTRQEYGIGNNDITNKKGMLLKDPSIQNPQSLCWKTLANF